MKITNKITECFKLHNYKLELDPIAHISSVYWLSGKLWNENHTLILAQGFGAALNKEDATNECIKDIYLKYWNTIPDNLDKDPLQLGFQQMPYINTMIKSTRGKLFSSEFKNIRTYKDTICLSRESLNYLFGYSGLGIGEDYDEAILNAVCSIYESYAKMVMLTNDGKYGYLIDKEKVEELGIELEYFDLSFDLDLPIIMLRVIDHKNYAYGYSFGAHPIKTKAKEKSLINFFKHTTEQLDKINIDNSNLIRINNPHNNIEFDKVNYYKPYANNDYFTNEYSTNKDLLLFLLSNIYFDIYVTKIDEVPIVRVFIPKIQQGHLISYDPIVKDLDCFNVVMQYNALLKDTIDNKEIDKMAAMITEAINDGIPIYLDFYSQCAFKNQIVECLMVLMAIINNNYDLYNDIIRKLKIDNEPLYKLYSHNFEDKNIEYLLEYIK